MVAGKGQMKVERMAGQTADCLAGKWAATRVEKKADELVAQLVA